MSAARFRKKPIEVDAICWNSQNLGSVQEFASGALGIGTVEGGALPLWVAKSSAVCRVEHGDWIIRETDGSGFYPCAADVFAATYEPADGPTIDAAGSATGDSSRASARRHGQAQQRTGAVDAHPAAAFDPERIRDILTGMLEASQADAVMLEVIGPLLEGVHGAGAEPAPARLTDAQCDRLRQMVTEHQDALSAVRRALDHRAALDDADCGIIAAGRAGLKVLEGSEGDARHG